MKKHHMFCRLLAGVLAAGLLSLPALAAEDTQQPQMPDP